VKGVNFYGPQSEFIISGSDCSNVFLWEKESEKIVQYFTADDGGVVSILYTSIDLALKLQLEKYVIYSLLNGHLGFR